MEIFVNLQSLIEWKTVEIVRYVAFHTLKERTRLLISMRFKYHKTKIAKVLHIRHALVCYCRVICKQTT